MRMGWLMTLVLVTAAAMTPITVGQAQAQEAQGKKTEGCSLPKDWDPVEDLPRILAEHREWAGRWVDNYFSEEWAENHPEGRANLCNANLSRVNLTGADLTKANLQHATLTKANLRQATLTEATLFNATLTEATLFNATLTEATLFGADLTGANLFGTDLTGASLTGASLTGASLAFADLTGATYAPASSPPNPSYLEGIRGLATVTFPADGGSGLVQLRELLQKAGLRDLERQATYAIERGRTRQL